MSPDDRRHIELNRTNIRQLIANRESMTTRERDAGAQSLAVSYVRDVGILLSEIDRLEAELKLRNESERHCKEMLALERQRGRSLERWRGQCAGRRHG